MLGFAMPTNQFSPRAGGKLRRCSNRDSPLTVISVTSHPNTVVTTKVPYSQTSLELSSRKVQAKSHPSSIASCAASLRQTTMAPPVVSEWENGGRNITNNQSQFTAVPHGTPNLLQQSDGSHGPKEAGTILPQKTECQDLIIRGQSSLQQSNKFMLEAADCTSSPSVPPLCLTLCEHLGPALRMNNPKPDKTESETRSTTKETTAARRSQSAKLSRKDSRMLNTCSTETALNNRLLVRGGPPAVVAVTDREPQTTASPDLNEQSLCPAVRMSPASRKRSPLAAGRLLNDPSPSVPSASADATQEKLPSLGDAISDEAWCPAGVLVSCVTTQISTIHLTKQGESAASISPSPSSPFPSLPLQTEARPTGETLLSGQACVRQVDGVEDELPDELENAGSDDGDSDCSSSSMASITLPSGIEEPMLLGVEDGREERPALVPSLFPLIPPTLYFSTANEKVELLPVEQRRLLKWKMSTVTPNVVKHTIARSHFKATKKKYDWLGCWGHHMKSPGFRDLKEHQKMNHFPGTFQIGRKDRLWRNLSKMQVRFGKQEFGFFPRTFILPQDIKLLRKVWEDSSTRQKWIIKPPASARGIGIQVIHKWSQMPRKRPLLVQKYLHKPYLISGNKFDLRIYVYVTSYDPLRIYMFSDGLVRFASCKYSSSMKTLSNKFMHLTNYSINKKNSEYQTNSDDKACQGHKWALKALWQYLGSQGINTTLIQEKIKDIVIKTIIASEPYVNNLLRINVRTPYSCHELFGFDIMLDENVKPWILEVNISPSLHSNSALDVSIKGQMIRDLLNLAGFRIPQREDVSAPCSSASSSTSSLCGSTRNKPDLSADEKVKRAFYLTQRYAEQDFLATVLDVLTPEDVRALAESEDELNRAGQFERVFPSPSSSRYLRFFECPRYLNILLDQWERKHWQNRPKGTDLLNHLCQKGIHLGTSDPAHMWSKCSYISKFDPHTHDLKASRSRVVVSHQHGCPKDNEDGSDGEVASFSSLSVSPSPGSSVASSACTSPQPSGLVSHQFASN